MPNIKMRIKFHAPEMPLEKKSVESFIDEAFSVKMAGYWRACNWTLLSSVHKRTTEELGHYPAMLTSSLGNNPESFLLTESEIISAT